MAAVRSQENIIKTSYQRNLTIVYSMLVNTEKLLRELDLIYAVIMIKACLCAPADMESTGDMSLSPVHDHADLIPVIHFLKGNIFHRCSGDYHTIKLLILDIIKGAIEPVQMIGGSVLRDMALCIHEGHVNLQRSV